MLKRQGAIARGLAQGLLSTSALCALGLAYEDSVCMGKTTEHLTDWVQLDPKSVYVDVNTSACGFQSAPVYVTSLAGDSFHWRSTGSSEIYLPTPTSFRLYLRFNDGITPADANVYGWHVNWLADGLGSSTPERGVCSGQTLSTSWAYYAQDAITVDVDTSACGFAATPVYVSSMVGAYSHYSSTGSSEIYTPSATGFTLNVHHQNGLTVSDAQSRNYYINWLADDGVCSGQTPSGSTNWVGLSDGLYVDVDTSACGFLLTPVYVTSMTGNHHHQTTGSSEVYSPSATGFRIYINSLTTPATANAQGWQVNWIARPRLPACTDTNGAAASAHYPCICGGVVCEELQLCLALESRCEACPQGYELTNAGCLYRLFHASSLDGGPCLQVLGHAVKANVSSAALGLVYVLTVILGALPTQFFAALGSAATAVDSMPSLESLELQSGCTQGWAVTPGRAEVELTEGAIEGPCMLTTNQSEGRILRHGAVGIYLNSTDPDSGLERIEKQWSVDVSLEFDAAATGVLGVNLRSQSHAVSESPNADSFSSAIELHRPEEQSQVLSQPHTLTIGDLRQMQQQLSPHLALEVVMVYLSTSHGVGDSVALVQNITDQVSRGLGGEGQFTFEPGIASFASCTAVPR